MLTLQKLPPGIRIQPYLQYYAGVEFNLRCDAGTQLRIKIPTDILTIDILSVLLILAIVLVPSTPARALLALPFLLLFPGLR